MDVRGALPLSETDQRRGDRMVYRLTESVNLLGVRIMAGFLTDLVSAPRWTRGWLPLSKMARAALLHDWLMNRSTWSRWKCNRFFRAQMAADGVGFFWRWLCWAYVSRPFAPRVRWHQPYLEGGE